ncbi:hypothetical protein HQQ82_15065 [Rathayibacter sp. VKM Ac-2856]|uniref:hypothetical protein n=1 Tax=unclassified Rathayibacter TaxID=2609250 RepID=UPI00156538E1|nr:MULTISPECIES: hypothetical protein [unclassified Rathayibacter]NQX05750.1 hypothetical protein [Rathayibacter sp. VKM Ac-2858]NQX21300.1 hypothetical protein [Rathayibacter sp. VKM Ac-2856]
MIIASLIALAITVYTVGRFALGTIPWRRTAQHLDRDRLRVLTRGVESVLVLLLARVFADWTLVSLAPWFALVVLAAAGAAGAVVRWRSLPWLEDPAKRRARTTGFAGTVALSALLVGVVGL